jgi:hypothetical protein
VTKTDRDALQRAIELAKAEDADRRRQVEGMQREDGWEYAATFAAYHCQRNALGLKPWQLTPCEIDDEQPRADPNKYGLLEAWELRQRLQACGLSVYEPNPPAALAAIAQAPRSPTPGLRIVSSSDEPEPPAA